ncbi:MAG: hypothetical protein M1296_02170 [Chloroflexi bacterium]|nr:hypothetical protein [Chloroflexota bacterium]
MFGDGDLLCQRRIPGQGGMTALRLPQSNGQTEGQVTKLKLLTLTPGRTARGGAARLTPATRGAGDLPRPTNAPGGISQSG